MVKPRRLIIHFENCDDPFMGLLRINRILPRYYEYKIADDRRLTVRFDESGHIIIYHDRSDAVVFGELRR